VGKKRQKDRSLARARRASMRRHPSFVEDAIADVEWCPPAWWMFPTWVIVEGDECPICEMLGIHHDDFVNGENVSRTAKDPGLSGPGSFFDQSPVVSGEIYREDNS